MSGPGEDYLELYRLYAAAELRVLETHDDWARFVLPDGRQGWVERDNIELI
jgi:SH3-like domain-containing protein